MSFKFLVHEVSDEVEINTETFSFDSMPEMLRVLADKITEVQNEGSKFNSISVGEALDLPEEEAIFVAYYVNDPIEFQFEVGTSAS